MIFKKPFTAGAEHNIYETDNPEKIAKTPRFWNLYSAHKILEDQMLCRRYLSQYIPNSEVISREEDLTALRANTRYLILQARVKNPKEITKKIMDEKSEVETVMKEIAANNRKMMEKTGASIEFLGLRNLSRCMLLNLFGDCLPEKTKENLTPTIPNVVEGDIGNHQGVYLIDTSLLQTRGEFFAKIIAKIFYPIEKFYMRKFFGLEI